jgi:hypothetical protein
VGRTMGLQPWPRRSEAHADTESGAVGRMSFSAWQPMLGRAVRSQGLQEGQALHVTPLTPPTPTPASCCRIQSNYMALQRINQELEDKLYRMVSSS